MSVLKPRTRMISVRLSQEEYAALRDICSRTGARSVSDATRDAVRTVLRGVNRDYADGANLQEFRSGMESLERRVEILEAKVISLKGEST